MKYRITCESHGGAVERRISLEGLKVIIAHSAARTERALLKAQYAHASPAFQFLCNAEVSPEVLKSFLKIATTHMSVPKIARVNSLVTSIVGILTND